jgi:hypothetical protein
LAAVTPGYQAGLTELVATQIVAGVTLADLSYTGALATFQTAIVNTVANSLNLANLGGGVSPPVVTSVRRRALLSEAWDAANAGEVGHAARTLLAAGRQLLQQNGVNAQYSIKYPTSAATTPGALTGQLQNAVANGAVTKALQAYGFPRASASSVTVAVGTLAPTPAPTLLSPWKISAIAVGGAIGVCVLFSLAWWASRGCYCWCCFPETLPEQFTGVQPEPESVPYLPYDEEETYDDGAGAGAGGGAYDPKGRQYISFYEDIRSPQRTV